MPINDRCEEVLEKFWIHCVEKGKDGCAVDQIEDKEALAELQHAELIEFDQEKMRLTPAGLKEAEGCIRRHRLAERLLADVLVVKNHTLHDTSCKLEHLLKRGLDENICSLLGHPKTCPHGRPIPPGKCCKDSKSHPVKLLFPLTEAKAKRKYKISHLQSNQRDVLEKLITMGAIPNAELTLLQRFPTYVFKIGKSQYAIDETLASHLYVRCAD